MPNMKHCFETIDGWDAYKYSDTELYNLLVQCSPDSDPQGFGYYREIPMIRMDVMEELGLESPKTFDELYDVLKAIKEAYPESYPWINPGGVNSPSSLQPVIEQMLVAWNGDVFSWDNYYTVYDAEEGKWSFALERPGFKEMIEYLTKAYAEELLDPEFLVAQSNQWEERMLNDKGFFSYAYWNNSDNINVKAEAAGKEGFKVMGILPPVKDGTASAVVRQVCNNTNAISASVENPEILVQVLDYWLYSRDGTMLANAGIEDVNYVWEEPDKIYRLIDPENPNPDNETHKAKYGVRYGYMTGLRPDHLGIHGYVDDPDNDVYYQQQLIFSGRGVNPAPVKIFKDEDDASIMKQQGMPIRDYIEQQLSRIITGVDDISTWDTLVQTCKDMGIDQVVEILNK